MTNKEPTINVTCEIKQSLNTNPFIRDLVCLVGGFETAEKSGEVFFAKTLAEAEEVFGDDVSIDANAALKKEFAKPISGVIIVNITTATSGENPTYNRNVTKTKLQDALTLLNNIEFDSFYVATELTDELITVIADFAADRFKNKKPFAWNGVATRATEAAYTTTIEKVGTWCVSMLTQPLEVNGDSLSLIESGAYISNLIARLNVGKSLTAKVLEEVTGLGTEYTFGSNDEGEPTTLGSKLVAMGYFVVRSVNPLEGSYEVVNSANHNGLDLYMIRSLSYIVNEFALRKYLGERNRLPTLDGVNMQCNQLLTTFRDDLDLVEDIIYTVSKIDKETAEVMLKSVQFSGIITTINVPIFVEVV